MHWLLRNLYSVLCNLSCPPYLFLSFTFPPLHRSSAPICTFAPFNFALRIRIRHDTLVDPLQYQDGPDEPARDEPRLGGIRGVP